MRFLFPNLGAIPSKAIIYIVGADLAAIIAAKAALTESYSFLEIAFLIL
jgi:hypothetical protein